MGFSFIADGRDEVLTATRENLRYGATQIKVHAGGGAATAYDPLDVTQYTLDELKAAVEAADDWNTYVTVHAYNAQSVRRSVEAGVKVIEHGQLLDEATVKLLGDKGIFLSLQALDPAPAVGTGQHPREEGRGHPRHRQRLQVGEAAQGQAAVGHRLPVQPRAEQEPEQGHPEAQGSGSRRPRR